MKMGMGMGKAIVSLKENMASSEMPDANTQPVLPKAQSLMVILGDHGIKKNKFQKLLFLSWPQ